MSRRELIAPRGERAATPGCHLRGALPTNRQSNRIAGDLPPPPRRFAGVALI